MPDPDPVVKGHGKLYVEQVLDEPRTVTLRDGTTAEVRPIGWVELGTVTGVSFTAHVAPPSDAKE